MAPKLGYLLPTRERIMEGVHETGPMLELADKAEALGYDSVWIGDSITSRPRHDPITLMAAVAARTKKVSLGTAVLLPALRHPVVMAHQFATVDRISEGRVILGVGIASDTPPIRAEFDALGVGFDKRVGRMMEALRLCRALWSGEPVDWDGRWTLKQQTVAPTPHRPGGPPIWGGGNVPAAFARAARNFDGWFPTGPDAKGYGEQWQEVQKTARENGRDPAEITPAVYLTLALDDDRAKADRRVDDYMAAYYGLDPKIMRKRQAAYAGPVSELGAWLKSYADAGAQHLMLRFTGNHAETLDAVAEVRKELGW